MDIEKRGKESSEKLADTKEYKENEPKKTLSIVSSCKDWKIVCRFVLWLWTTQVKISGLTKGSILRSAVGYWRNSREGEIKSLYKQKTSSLQPFLFPTERCDAAHQLRGIEAPLCFLLSACKLKHTNLVARNLRATWRQRPGDKAFTPFFLSLEHSASLLSMGYSPPSWRGGPTASIHNAHLWHRPALCSTLGKNTQHSPSTIYKAWPPLSCWNVWC